MKRRSETGVGYKHPPKHSRFKPGQSGNPRGRPKGRRGPLDLGSMLARALEALVTVTEKGRRRRLPIGDFLLRKLVNNPVQGGPRDYAILLRYLEAFPLPEGDKDRFGQQIDYGAEVRAKLEQMALNIAEREKRDAAAKEGPEPNEDAEKQDDPKPDKT